MQVREIINEINKLRDSMRGVKPGSREFIDALTVLLCLYQSLTYKVEDELNRNEASRSATDARKVS